jgi:hypothetical protein
MRDVAKSMLGFTWAMSMFGMQQMVRMAGLADQTQRERTAADFDEVAQSLRQHMSSATAERFQKGDEWQRRMVDTVFDAAANPRTLVQDADPRRMVDAGREVLARGVDAVKHTFQASAAPVAAEPAPAAPAAEV